MTFGDTDGQEGHDQMALSPIGDMERVDSLSSAHVETQMGVWGKLIEDILVDLRRLETGLMSMRRERLRLEVAGMWPAVPTESWEPRTNSTHGEARYLRLLFPAGTRGQKRYRVYVGSKQEAIAEARRKAVNRRRWEKLDEEIAGLERCLRNVEAALNRQRLVVSMRPLPDLGTAAGSGEAAGVTNDGFGD